MPDSTATKAASYTTWWDTIFSSLEAHINSICEELSSRPEFSIHERAFLMEKEVRLEGGEFKAKGLKMSRLEDKISYLIRPFSGESLPVDMSWWSGISASVRLRNKLTHPKDFPPISVSAVTNAIQSIIDCLNYIYMTIYKKPFPASIRGLHSKLNF